MIKKIPHPTSSVAGVQKVTSYNYEYIQSIPVPKRTFSICCNNSTLETVSLLLKRW